MVNSTEFAKRLDKILDYYGISATAFSDEIKVNRSTISHLLSGRNKPSLDFVLKVVKHYPEVELYWLLNGKGSFPSEPQSKNIPPKDFVETDTLKKEAGNSTAVKSSDTAVGSKNPESGDSAIERIVVFYRDGSFKSYEN